MLVLRSFVSVHIRRLCSVAGSLKETISTKHLDFTAIKHQTKVPLQPCVTPPAQEPPIKFEIDKESLELLERFALVNIRDKEALKVLEDSIAFASKILHIDTTNVEPLYHVHSEQYLQLRDDVETEGNIADQLLKNAPLTEEEYFVSPPGNVELDAEEKKF